MIIFLCASLCFVGSLVLVILFSAFAVLWHIFFSIPSCELYGGCNDTLGIHLSLTGIENEMSVMFSAPLDNSNNSDFLIRYGTDSSLLGETQVAERANHQLFGYHRSIYEAILPFSSSANETWYYQIVTRNGEKNISDVYDIRTFTDLKTNPTSPTEFLVGSDRQGESYLGIVDLLKKKHIHDTTIKASDNQIHAKFMLFPGDFVFADKLGDEDWDRVEDKSTPISSIIPIMHAPGNHDVDRYLGFRSYQKRISSHVGVNSGSGTNLYYSFTYKYFHIISLSTEHPFNEGSKQYKWLVDTLEQRVDRQKTPFLIVQYHKPMYTSSSGKAHESHLCLRYALEHLFQKHKVTVVFNGHIHGYERTCEVYSETCFSSGNVLNGESNKLTLGTVHVIHGTLGQGRRPWKNPDHPEPWDMIRSNTYKGYLRCIGEIIPEPKLSCKSLIFKNGSSSSEENNKISEEDQVFDEFVIMYQSCFGRYPYEYDDVCSGKGTCIGFDHCECIDGYDGLNCNVSSKIPISTSGKMESILQTRKDSKNNESCPKFHFDIAYFLNLMEDCMGLLLLFSLVVVFLLFFCCCGVLGFLCFCTGILGFLGLNLIMLQISEKRKNVVVVVSLLDKN